MRVSSLKMGLDFMWLFLMGLVCDVFSPEMIKELKGSSAIGHVRYSTTGSSDEHNIQPLYSKTSKGKFAIAHNGNLTNAHKYYTKLKKEGALFQSTVDSEVLLHLVARSKSRSIVEAVRKELANIEGDLFISVTYGFWVDCG